MRQKAKVIPWAFIKNALGAMLLLWLIDSSLLLMRSTFAPKALLVLIVQSISASVLIGIMLGVGEYLAFALSFRVAESLAGKRGKGGRRAAVQAAILTAICSPFIAYLSYQLFQGAGISRTAIAPAGPYLACLVGLCLVFMVMRFLVLEASSYRFTREGGNLWRILLLASFLGFFYWADATLYIGLYGYIHATLAVLSIASCQLLLATISSRLRSRVLYRRKAVWRRAGLWGAGIITVLLFLYSGHLMAGYPVVEHALFERSVIGSKVMRFLSKAGLYPSTAVSEEDRGMALVLWNARRYRESPLKGVAEGMNIVLITVDALRWDQLGVYGSQNANTTNMDGLGRRGIVCDKFFCQSIPATTWSVASLFSSDIIDAPYEEEAVSVTLPALLKKEGYVTIQANTSYWDFSMSDRITRGFAVSAPKRYGPIEEPVFLDEMTTRYAIRGIEDDWQRPFFLWAHLFAPHYEHRPFMPGMVSAERKAARTSPEALYREAIAYADACIGRIMEALERKGIEEETIIAITSDHGEAFSEHGFRYHGRSAYNEVIRLPFILFIPGLPAARLKINTGTLDVAPTLLEAVGITSPPSFLGMSLLASLGSVPGADNDYVVCRSREADALIKGNHKLIRNREYGLLELYDLEKDPGEQRSLASEESARCAEMAGILTGLIGELSRHHAAPGGLEPTIAFDEIEGVSLDSFIAMLEETLEKEEPILRRKAIKALARKGDEPSIDVLVKLIYREEDLKTLKVLHDELTALNRPRTVRPLIQRFIELDYIMRTAEGPSEKDHARWLYYEMVKALDAHGDEETLQLCEDGEGKATDLQTWKNYWVLFLALKSKGIGSPLLNRARCLEWSVFDGGSWRDEAPARDELNIFSSGCPLYGHAGEVEGASMRLRTFLRSPSRRECRLLFFAEGRIEIRFNDKPLFSQPRAYEHGIIPDVVSLTLDEGWNELSVRTTGSFVAFGAAIILPEPESINETLSFSTLDPR